MQFCLHAGIRRALPWLCFPPACISWWPGDSCPDACSSRRCSPAAPSWPVQTNPLNPWRSFSLPGPLWWSGSGWRTAPALDGTLFMNNTQKKNQSRNTWEHLQDVIFCSAADNKIPFWLPPVTPQPYRTGSGWWRSQSSVPVGLGRSFHSGPQQSAGEQRTAGWQRPAPGLWKSSQPRGGEGKRLTWCNVAPFWNGFEHMELEAACLLEGHCRWATLWKSATALSMWVPFSS